MNLKKLICIAVVAGLGSHAYAMEIYKGKVISEKVWSNDGSKAVTGINKKQQFRHESSDVFEEVVSSISSDYANVNVPVTMNNMHLIRLYNKTDATKDYRVMESICSQTSDNLNRCIYYHKQIQLEPNGYVTEGKEPILEMTYTKPGRYRVTVMTVADDGSVPHISEGRATIFVS